MGSLGDYYRLLTLLLPVVLRLPVSWLAISRLTVGRLIVHRLSVGGSWLLLRDNDRSSIVVVVVHGVHGGLLLKAFCLFLAIAIAGDSNDDDDSDDCADDCSADGAGTSARVVILAVVIVRAVVVRIVAIGAISGGAATTTRGAAVVPASIQVAAHVD